ncbi:MAG: hypothetical protein NTW08_00010 [Gammaproteobacteria bacterium]|nr:hypothetical protein [Gammaproteobacteria bacterium]
MLTENELIQHLAEQKDGTHNYAFTVSVAKSILRLRERYASQSRSFETIALEIRGKKFSQESTIIQAEWDRSVDYLIAKVTEAQDQFDVVNLYFRMPHAVLPSFDIIKHEFSLKEVLVLVWIALHDDKAYERHYCGSDLEKLQRAKADQKARLESFFQILKSIQTGICHHGVRNELILSLNETHIDVSVIESPEGTIIDFIRQRLHHCFWEAYRQNPNCTILRSGLITWMKESKVDKLFLQLDPTNQLLKDIQAIFEKYGIDPNPVIIKFDGKSLEEYVCAVQSALDFDCDRVCYPHLYEMHQLLTVSDHFSHPEALEKIRSWISSDFFFANMSANQRNVSAFYKYYTVLVQLEKYRSIFIFLNVLEVNFMSTLEKNCEKPFVDYLEYNVVPTLSDTTVLEQIQAFTKAIECFKNDTPNWIINFFEKWYKNQNNTFRASLFKMMISSELKEKIAINTQDIVNFKRCVFQRGRVNLDGQVYWINRFFLAAIMSHPSQWSNEFANHLEMICHNLEQLDRVKMHALNINPDAYPAQLLMQLRYLCEKYKQLHGVLEPIAVSERPENMLLHPELCETYRDWLNIYQLLIESFPKELWQIYKRYSERVWSAILNLPFLSALSPNIKQCLNARENKAMIQSNPLKAIEIISCLDVFYATDPQLVNNDTRLFIKQLIQQNFKIIYLIAPVIRCLYQTSPMLITFPYLDMLTSGEGVYAIQIANTVISLYNFNKALLTKERCALIKERGGMARYLAQTLRVLEETNRNLINESNLILLMSHNAHHLWRVSEALCILSSVKPNIINQVLLQELVENNEYAIELASIIHFLMDVKPELVTVKNIELYKNQLHVSGKFNSILRVIHELIPNFITQSNFEALFKVCKNHYGIIETLRFLQKTNPKLLTKESVHMILEKSHQLINLREVLSMLHGINPNLINEENLNRIFMNHIELVLKVKFALQHLSHSNPTQITNETIRNMFSNPSQLSFFRRGERCVLTGQSDDVNKRQERENGFSA